MGTNNHASSQSKSNLQSLKKRIKKKGLKVKTSGDNHQNNDDTDRNEGRPRMFWWKWLNFVRWNWPRHGSLSHHGGSKSARRPMRSFGTSSGSNATGMDVIEIPIDSGQKISKILIKPTRTGIKAMIAQCRAQGDNERFSEEDLRLCETLNEKSMTKTRLEERGEYQEKRLMGRVKSRKNEVDITNKNESLLTSALFIRRDMENIVESAMFIEPTLPNDYLDSGKSEESLKINRRHVSYRIVDERNYPFRSTLKTVSEPTWVEKREILRRRCLQDNINSLLEQFMFLEADDSAGLAVTNDKKPTVCGENPSLRINEYTMKEISREVSPEILVNIKPFKEYLSDDYVKVEEPEPAVRQEVQPSQIVYPQRGTPRPLKKDVFIREHNRKVEEQLTPILSELLETDYADAVNCSEIMGSTEAAKTQKEAPQFCYETKEAKNPPVVEETAPSVCAVWGVCKTYSHLNIPPEKEDPLPEKESLDELLNTLDDSDHDAVFQKNISQFRKKIASTSRLEFKKCCGRMKDVKNKEQKKKPKRRHCQMEFSKPIIECVMEESEEEKSLLQDCVKRRTNCLWLKRWECETKRGKMMETPFLLFSERNLVRRVFACRMEEALRNTLAKLRVVQSLVEGLNYTVVQREKTMFHSGKVNEVALVGVKRPEILQAPEITIGGMKLEAVTKMFAVQGDGFGYKVGTEPGHVLPECQRNIPFFTNITDCFYMIHSPLSVSSGLLDPNTMSPLSFEELSVMDWAEASNGKCQDKCQTPKKEIILHLQPVYDETQTVTMILDTPFYYPLTVHGVQPTSRKPSSRNLTNDNDNTGYYILDELGKFKKSDMDGFKILFNVRDSLCFDDDDTVKEESMKNFEDQHVNVFLEEPRKKPATQKIGDMENIMHASESDVSSDVSERNQSKFLNFKSSSSPRENIIQNEFGSPEHRTRRSQILAKETENIFQTCKKRRSSADKGMEIRRTGSAVTEVHSPKLGQEKVFIDPKPASGGEREKKFGTLILPEELKMKITPELRTLEKKIHLSDCSKVNVRREVIAAFNSIKELNSLKGEGRGGNKRMSLVIMLSKK